MIRTIIITLVNLLLPYIVYALWEAYGRWRAAKQQGERIVDVTPQPKGFPFFKLLLVGVLLLGLSLITLRIMDGTGETPEWTPGNPSQSVDY